MSDLPPPWYPAPSMADLRAQLADAASAMSTGWPVLDAALGGLRPGQAYAVQAPPPLRRQLMARMAAWAAGDGYAVALVSANRPAARMKLEVLAAGCDVTPDELAASTAHDEWLDELLPSLRLRVLGSGDRPRAALEQLVLSGEELDLLVVEDVTQTPGAWARALMPQRMGLEWDHQADLQALVHHRPLALVLGGGEDLSLLLDTDALGGSVDVSGPGDRAAEPGTVSARVTTGDGLHRRVRLGMRDDRLLVAPVAGAVDLLARPGHPNLWLQAPVEGVDGFADVLGATRLW